MGSRWAKCLSIFQPCWIAGESSSPASGAGHFSMPRNLPVLTGHISATWDRLASGWLLCFPIPPVSAHPAVKSKQASSRPIFQGLLVWTTLSWELKIYKNIPGASSGGYSTLELMYMAGPGQTSPFPTCRVRVSRMPQRMSDRMSEHMSDRMPDGEYVHVSEKESKQNAS